MIDFVSQGYDVNLLEPESEDDYLSFNWWFGKLGNGEERLAGCRILDAQDQEDLEVYAPTLLENTTWSRDELTSVFKAVSDKINAYMQDNME